MDSTLFVYRFTRARILAHLIRRGSSNPFDNARSLSVCETFADIYILLAKEQDLDKDLHDRTLQEQSDDKDDSNDNGFSDGEIDQDLKSAASQARPKRKSGKLRPESVPGRRHPRTPPTPPNSVSFAACLPRTLSLSKQSTAKCVIIFTSVSPGFRGFTRSAV